MICHSPIGVAILCRDSINFLNALSNYGFSVTTHQPNCHTGCLIDSTKTNNVPSFEILIKSLVRADVRYTNFGMSRMQWDLDDGDAAVTLFNEIGKLQGEIGKQFVCIMYTDIAVNIQHPTSEINW